MEIVPNMPEDGRRINIEGEKGESIFRRPVIWFIQEDFKRIKEQYEAYQKLIEGAKEERLLAIVGALSMEEALDSFLGAYIPGYKRLLRNIDFTLSMKVEILYSLRLIPAHIANTADLIRKIRNDFSHDLSINCFESLKEERRNRLKVRFGKLFPDDKTHFAPENMFVRVVEAVIIGLGVYASHLTAAREYIYSEDFSTRLVERIKGKSK